MINVRYGYTNVISIKKNELNFHLHYNMRRLCNKSRVLQTSDELNATILSPSFLKIVDIKLCNSWLMR